MAKTKMHKVDIDSSTPAFDIQKIAKQLREDIGSMSITDTVFCKNTNTYRKRVVKHRWRYSFMGVVRSSDMQLWQSSLTKWVLRYRFYFAEQDDATYFMLKYCS